MRDFKETLEWYRTHNTSAEIGFDTDGMCLKICRTARDIGSRYLSAKEAQDATPRDNRFFHVRNLRRGMVLFFDDPNDSNRYGHIVTVIGRVKDANRDSLDDLLVKTNSVKANEVVTVRASYFSQHWGDPFQFGADWLNGVELDIPAKKVHREPFRKQHFRESRPDWDIKILEHGARQGRRDLDRLVTQIEDAVDEISDDVKNENVREFKKTFKRHRVLKLHLLNDVPASFTKVRAVRNRLRGLVMRAIR